MEHPAPHLVTHEDAEAQREWQRFVSSGMPELIANHNFVHALFAFVDTGMARRMVNDARPLEEIVEGDRELGAALLRFLEIRGVVLSTAAPKLTWSLTARGRDLVSDLSIAQLGFYREAYGPVLDSLSPLISQKRSYPQDVVRNGEALGRHSADGFHYFGLGVTLRALESLGASCLVDLGCGAAGFLIDACTRQPALRGVGLDISPEAVESARTRVAEAGLTDRIQLHVGDAFTPESWPAACREADAMLTVGTLHEQFRNGEDAVLALLERYARLMRPSAGHSTMKGMVLGEPELHYNAQDADFFLLHVATKQGLPRARDEWLRLFERSALRCDALFEAVDHGPRFAYYVLRAR